MAGARFNSSRNVQTGAGPHPASCSVGTCGSYSGGKAAGALGWPLTCI